MLNDIILKNTDYKFLTKILYSLKPGTMIEWGNNWARGLTYRRSQNEAFAGYFSQIGRLYNVHHIWCKFKIFFNIFSINIYTYSNEFFIQYINF